MFISRSLSASRSLTLSRSDRPVLPVIPVLSVVVVVTDVPPKLARSGDGDSACCRKNLLSAGLRVALAVPVVSSLALLPPVPIIPSHVPAPLSIDPRALGFAFKLKLKGGGGAKPLGFELDNRPFARETACADRLGDGTGTNGGWGLAKGKLFVAPLGPLDFEFDGEDCE